MRAGASSFRVGLIVLAAVALFSYWAYTQVNPFSNPFAFSAVFESASNVKAGSPVRIAGVQVGEVTEIEPVGGDGGARVTMEVSDEGLPIHRDAEIKIRPRIFLEGNFFLDVEPGSPSAPAIDDGDTIPVQQTATPVQFADVLAALQSDTRTDLQEFLNEYSRGLRGAGARGINEAYRFGEEAYRTSALANEAALGTEERDLSRLVRGQQRTFGALARHEENLRDLVTNFNTFAAALAREDRALEASIPALDEVLRVGSPALRSLNNALPSVRAFARDALPGTVSAGPTLEANLPLIRQARRLVSEAELKGLARDLRPTVPDLVELGDGQIRLLRQARALSACQNEVLLPFATTPIPDPDFPAASGQPFYEEAPRSFVGLAGESRISDANTPLYRINVGGGPTTLLMTGDTGERFFAQALFPILGTRPARPPRRPVFRPDVPCETQEAPNLYAPAGPADQAVNPNPVSTAESRRRDARSQADYQRVLRHLQDLVAGRPTIDPLAYNNRGERLAARRLGLRRLEDGRYVRVKQRGRNP
jgi:phospholipid/cholesterol/gamma-HCH transport system substrate-binding protein